MKLIKNTRTGIGVSVFTLQRYFHRHQTVKHIHPKSKQSFIISRLAVVSLFLGGRILVGSHGGCCLWRLAGRGDAEHPSSHFTLNQLSWTFPGTYVSSFHLQSRQPRASFLLSALCCPSRWGIGCWSPVYMRDSFVRKPEHQLHGLF